MLFWNNQGYCLLVPPIGRLLYGSRPRYFKESYASAIRDSLTCCSRFGGQKSKRSLYTRNRQGRKKANQTPKRFVRQRFVSRKESLIKTFTRLSYSRRKYVFNLKVLVDNKNTEFTRYPIFFSIPLPLP